MPIQLPSTIIALAFCVACAACAEKTNERPADAGWPDGMMWDSTVSADAYVAPQFCPVVERLSVPATGGEADGGSFVGDISDDGRFVAFISNATNLVAGTNNGRTNTIILDRDTGVMELANVNSLELLSNDSGTEPAISNDGRYVTFQSRATNLVSPDVGGHADIFLRDRAAGTTVFAGVSSAGEQANLGAFDTSISADGRFIALASGSTNLAPNDTNGLADVFVRDNTMGTTEMVSVSSSGEQGDGGSLVPTLSNDGRYVLFSSVAKNLVPNDTNDRGDMFLRDRMAGTTERVSVSNSGEQVADGGFSGVVSGDGSAVVFLSRSNDLVDGDTLDGVEVFVRDRAAGTTTRVHVSTPGNQADAEAERVGLPVDISDDGRFVVFISPATNLVEGDTNAVNDAFLHDRTTGTTVRLSVNLSGEGGDAQTRNARISGDGRFIIVNSTATNLVEGDANGAEDVFLVANCLLGS